MADEIKLDPMAAKLAAEMSSKTLHSFPKREMPISAWAKTAVKEEALHCLNCSYCAFGIDELKLHVFTQHPGSAAVVSTCGGEEALVMPDMTFFCVKKMCPHWSSICFVYEDHLMKCCPLSVDLNQAERESLKSTFRFLLNFHRKHNLTVASGFLHFACTHPEGIPLSEYKAVGYSADEQNANVGIVDNSELSHGDACHHEDTPSCYGKGSRPTNAEDDSEIKISPIDRNKQTVDNTLANISNVKLKGTSHIISKFPYKPAHLSSAQYSNLSTPTAQMVYKDSGQERQKKPASRITCPKFRFDTSHIISTMRASKVLAKQSMKINVTAETSGPKFRLNSPKVSQRPPADQLVNSKFGMRTSYLIPVGPRFTLLGISATPTSKSNPTQCTSLSPRFRFCSQTHLPVSVNSSSQKALQHNTIRQSTILRTTNSLPQNIVQAVKDNNCKFLPMKMTDSNTNTQKSLYSSVSSADEPKAYLSSKCQVQVLILQSGKFTGAPTKSDVLTQVASTPSNQPKEVSVKPSPKLKNNLSFSSMCEASSKTPTACEQIDIQNVQTQSKTQNSESKSHTSFTSSSSTSEASSEKPASGGQMGIQFSQTHSTSIAQTSPSVSHASLTSSSSKCEASSKKSASCGHMDIHFSQTHLTSKTRTSKSVVPKRSQAEKFSVNSSQNSVKLVKHRKWCSGLRMQFGSKMFFSCHICHHTYTLASIMIHHLKVHHTNEYRRICDENVSCYHFLYRKKQGGTSFFKYISKADTDNEHTAKEGQESSSQAHAIHEVGGEASANHLETDSTTNSEMGNDVSGETFQNSGNGNPATASSATQTDAQLFKCTMCPAVFTEPMEAIRHVKGHVGENAANGHRLQEFLKTYKNKFKSPRKTHDVEKPYHCTKCKKHFGYLEDFNKHLSSHPQLMKLIRKQMTSHGKNMKLNGNKHMKSHACNRKSQIANWIIMKSQANQEMSHNKASEKKRKRRRGRARLQVQCDECDRLVLKVDLRFHKLRHAGVKLYKCNVCEKEFIKKYALNLHKKIHKGNLPHKCIICNKVFLREIFLNRHIRTCGKLKNICSVCSKEFNCRSSLDIHMRVHTGEKPFLCAVCGRGFSQGCSLNNHMRLHTGEKPFKCDKCEKKFCVQDGLIKHMRWHTGEKPFKCPVCDRTFTQSGNVKIHMRSYHKGENPGKDK